MQKAEKPEFSARYLENSGGPILVGIALLSFIGYLAYVHGQENLNSQQGVKLVATLQKHSSAAQTVSIASVLLAALIHWGIEKVLFKIKERERLINRILDLEERDAEKTARLAALESLDAEKAARIAELESLDAEKAARIAELEAREAQQTDDKRQ